MYFFNLKYLHFLKHVVSYFVECPAVCLMIYASVARNLRGNAVLLCIISGGTWHKHVPLLVFLLHLVKTVSCRILPWVIPMYFVRRSLKTPTVRQRFPFSSMCSFNVYQGRHWIPFLLKGLKSIIIIYCDSGVYSYHPKTWPGGAHLRPLSCPFAVLHHSLSISFVSSLFFFLPHP